MDVKSMFTCTGVYMDVKYMFTCTGRVCFDVCI